MKKRILHIIIPCALFCILTVMFLIRSKDSLAVHTVNESQSDAGVRLTSAERYECIGEPIQILSVPTKVRHGDEVSIAFKGETNTEYGIRVYYPSGLSQSEAFSPRKSDSKGRFGWDFTVSDAAKAGRLRIVILSEKTHFMTEIEIVD